MSVRKEVRNGKLSDGDRSYLPDETAREEAKTKNKKQANEREWLGEGTCARV